MPRFDAIVPASCGIGLKIVGDSKKLRALATLGACHGCNSVRSRNAALLNYRPIFGFHP